MWMRLLVAILALALVSVAGCGGDEQTEQYIDDFNEVKTSFEQSTQGLDFSDLTTEEGQADLERVATAADEAASDMRDVDPPDEVAEQSGEMVALFEEIRDITREQLDILAGEIDERDAEALEELAEDTGQAGERIDALTDEIAAELDVEVEG